MYSNTIYTNRLKFNKWQIKICRLSHRFEDAQPTTDKPSRMQNRKSRPRFDRFSRFPLRQIVLSLLYTYYIPRCDYREAATILFGGTHKQLYKRQPVNTPLQLQLSQANFKSDNNDTFE